MDDANLSSDDPAVLRNGVTIPRLGLGVFQTGPGEATRQAVRHALELGYRHIDTAAIYHNEVEVGEALRQWCDDTGSSRAEVFVTTKLWNDDHGYRKSHRALDRSLERLGLDTIDLYLLHWPVPRKRRASWRALEERLARGTCRAIGVSNFTIDHLEALIRKARVVPHVNQVELHPFLPQHDLVRWCRQRGIQTVAYSPLTKGRLLDDPTLASVARRLGRTPAQVLIRWGLEQGHVVLPKSSNRQRIAENAAVFDFALDDAARVALGTLGDRGVRLAWDPTNVR